MGRLRKAVLTATLDSPDSLVLPRKYYDEYISRQVGPNVREFDVFNYARKSKMNVLIEGPTGPGKTSACMAFAALHGMPFYAIQSSAGAEPSQIFGRMVQDEHGMWKFQDGGLTALVRLSHTRPCMLLVNEINFLPPKIATVLFALLDKRRSITLVEARGEIIEAGDLMVVADMNPDYVGTRQLNEALINRFGLKMVFDYDIEVERKLVKSLSLLRAAKKLRDEQANGMHNTPVSTNSLIEFEKVAKELGLKYACVNFVNMFRSDYRSAVANAMRLEEDNIAAEYNGDMSGEQLTHLENALSEVRSVEPDTDETMSVEDYMKTYRNKQQP